MHAEWGEISKETAAATQRRAAAGGRIVSIGTTSLRLLETARRGRNGPPFRGDTDIFITPGYRFKIVDLLLTNFHLPRSTLFMLVRPSPEWSACGPPMPMPYPRATGSIRMATLH